MKIRSKYSNWALLVIGGAIPAFILLSVYFRLSIAVFVPITVLLLFIFGSSALWLHANRRADEHQWWQDDHASGWRGY